MRDNEPVDSSTSADIRRLAQERLVTQIGAVNSFAAVGTLCAAAPLAVMVEYIGWRSSYWIFTSGIGVLTVAMLLLMRDRPPGKPAAAKMESLREMLAGVGQAARQPAMWRLLVVGLPMSAASIIMGAWGAPYLKDVHGLDSIENARDIAVLARRRRKRLHILGKTRAAISDPGKEKTRTDA